MAVPTKQVYPCRCGEVHRGDYAIYDYGHHACFHDSLLLLIADDQALCPDCGKSFGFEDKRGVCGVDEACDA